MKITAKCHFLANGVEGYPGKVLSAEEIKKIASCMLDMKAHDLILVEEISTPGLPKQEIQTDKPQPGNGSKPSDDLGLKSVSKALNPKTNKL